MCIIESSGHVQVTKTNSGANPGAGYNPGEKTRCRVCEDQQKTKNTMCKNHSSCHVQVTKKQLVG
jgi:hypothetical protein